MTERGKTNGNTDGDDKGVTALLAEVLKTINKDSLAQLAPSRVVQGTPAIGALCAYKALDKLAQRIAAKVAKQIVKTSTQPTGNPTKVILQAGEEMSDLLEYHSLMVRLDTIQAQLADAIREGRDALQRTADPTIASALEGSRVAAFFDPATVALVGSAAQAALAVIGFFTRTVTSEQHGNVAIADADLLAAVAKALGAATIETLRPSTLALKAAEWAYRNGGLIKRLEALDHEARTLRRVMGGIETLLTPKPAGPAKAATTAADQAAVAARIREITGDAAPPVETTGEGAPGSTRVPDAAALRAAKSNGEAALASLANTWSALPAALPRLIRADAIKHVLASGGLLLGLRILVASGAAIRTETGSSIWSEKEERGIGTVLGSFVLLDGRAIELESGRLTATVSRQFVAPEMDSDTICE